MDAQELLNRSHRCLGFLQRRKSIGPVVFLSIVFGAGVASAQSGTASLYNLSAPYTEIEVGNVVQVSILNAARNGSVTVKLDLNPLTYVGQTDPNTGNAFYQATETAANVGFHTERWFVNGVEVPYSNPSPYIDGPNLPFFSVYYAFSGMNCAGQDQHESQCSTNHPLHWIWEPVTAVTTSSIARPSMLDTAITDWNVVTSKLSFSSDAGQREDTNIYDMSCGRQYCYGVTVVWGQECNTPCLNQIDLCNGACLNSSAVYFVSSYLDTTEIANLAQAITNVGYDSSGLTLLVLEHEMATLSD